MGRRRRALKSVDLDGLCIKFQPLLLVNKEFLNIFPLIALKLNHLAHLGIVDNGAIAGCTTSFRTWSCDIK